MMYYLTDTLVFFSCVASYSDEAIFMSVIFYGPLIASYCFILAAVMDRFIAIRLPMRYTRLVTTRTIRLAAAVMWILSLGSPITCVVWIKSQSAAQSAVNQGIIVLSYVMAYFTVVTASVIVILNLLIILYAWLSMVKRKGE